MVHQDVTANVLEGLERSLRLRSKDSWGISFCAILILCLCIEDLETAADTLVIVALQDKYSREQSSEACKALEEYPFRRSKELFHSIYKTTRSAKEWTGARDVCFNSLRAVQGGSDTHLDVETDKMVREVYHVVSRHWNDTKLGSKGDDGEWSV